MIALDINTLILIDYKTLSIIFFCLTGATVKDIYNTLKGIDNKVKLTRILVSAITSSILIYSFSDILFEMGFSSKMITGISFLTGVSGFNALEKLSNLEGLINFLKYIKAYFDKDND